MDADVQAGEAGAVAGQPALSYLVSCFPQVSETFIVRELDAVAQQEQPDVQLRSLFPAPPGPVHDIARPWVDRLERPEARAAISAMGWAVRNRPVQLARVVGMALAGYARKPALLPRAFVTVGLATAHARTLSTTGVRHVHAHYATYPALAAWVCRRLVGTRYSFTAHAHDLYVDQIHAQPQGRRGRARGHHLRVQPRAAPSSPGRRLDPRRRRPLRHRDRPLPVPDSPDARRGPIRALCVASLQEYKGHRVLLEAIADGGSDVSRIHLDLIGNGSLRNELEQLATTLGIADRVRFLGGRSESEVRDALDAADLFVLPSIVPRDGQMEGLPVALMEALACGIPTVSTRLSGIPEIVVDGVTGLLAEPGNADDLRRVLQRAVTETAETLEQRAVAGRRLVEEQFELKTCEPAGPAARASAVLSGVPVLEPDVEQPEADHALVVAQSVR